MLSGSYKHPEVNRRLTPLPPELANSIQRRSEQRKAAQSHPRTTGCQARQRPSRPPLAPLRDCCASLDRRRRPGRRSRVGAGNVQGAAARFVQNCTLRERGKLLSALHKRSFMEGTASNGGIGQLSFHNPFPKCISKAIGLRMGFTVQFWTNRAATPTCWPIPSAAIACRRGRRQPTSTDRTANAARCSPQSCGIPPG